MRIHSTHEPSESKSKARARHRFSSSSRPPRERNDARTGRTADELRHEKIRIFNVLQIWERFGHVLEEH